MPEKNVLYDWLKPKLTYDNQVLPALLHPELLNTLEEKKIIFKNAVEIQALAYASWTTLDWNPGQYIFTKGHTPKISSAICSSTR